MPEHSRTVLSHPDFARYFYSRLLGNTAEQLVLVALAQFIYELTRSPLNLGLTGLMIFIAKLGLTLPAGHIADHYQKKSVMGVMRGLGLVVLLALTGLVMAGANSLPLFYLLLFFWGAAVAIEGPAGQALVPEIVSTEDFPNAVAWSSSAKQVAILLGPVLGGGLYAVTASPLSALIASVAMVVASLVLISGIKKRSNSSPPRAVSFTAVFEGLRYVWRTKLILGIISLDLFAVLFGGAVALMPIYANDILRVGPMGLGVLRAAPAVGAAVMAYVMAGHPPLKNVGHVLLVCVALFGAFTIIFAISKNFLISLVSLCALGAFDMVSMIIRGVLVQTRTPPELRGRVSAVNLVFIGASNELGEFESGLTAEWFGVVPAAILGGVGTLIVVATWWVIFPAIRRVRLMEDAT